MQLERDKIHYLTCGVFNSNSWGIPMTYRIYLDKIECDSTGNYFSKRFTKEGYQFYGEKEIKTSNDDLTEIVEIFNKIPKNCFTMPLPFPNTPGNKDENTIYIQIVLIDGTSAEFKIDEYDNRELRIDNDILIFKDEI